MKVECRQLDGTAVEIGFEDLGESFSGFNPDGSRFPCYTSMFEIEGKIAASIVRKNKHFTVVKRIEADNALLRDNGIDPESFL